MEAITLPSYAPEVDEGMLCSQHHHNHNPSITKIVEACSSVPCVQLGTQGVMYDCCIVGPSTNALAELMLADGQTFKARLVVGADGARSRTRQLAGVHAFIILHQFFNMPCLDIPTVNVSSVHRGAERSFCEWQTYGPFLGAITRGASWQV